MILMYDSVLSVSLARRQPVEPLRMHGQIQTHANVMQNNTISLQGSFTKFPRAWRFWSRWGRQLDLDLGPHSQLLANCIPFISSNSKPHFSPLIWPDHLVIDIHVGMMPRPAAR
jgi:hypothetical protein